MIAQLITDYNDFGSMFSGHDVIGQAFEEIQSGAGGKFFYGFHMLL